jgi:5'-3' exonuclease
MALILDYSGIAHAAYFASPSAQVEENIIRHMILNSVRMYVTKYSKEYGQVYIACDGGSWRRERFEFYKAARKRDAAESVIDWKEFYRITNMVAEELRQFFPYKVIRVPGAEADDIIAYLVEQTTEFGSFEQNMIISSDHDFIQLQAQGNVKQFSPNTKKLVTEKNVHKYAFEQILRGCSSDGVPNFLSDDDSIISEDKRQTPIRAKRVDELYGVYQKLGLEGVKNTLSQTELRNFLRNQELIVLASRPEYVSKAIESEIAAQPHNNNSKIYGYLVERRCRNLISCVDEFFPKTNK